MRHYSTVQSTFWTGKTGRSLRSDHNSQLLAMYLVTAPSANMIGLYYIPIVTMAHDTGLTEDEVRASLTALKLADGFLDWDEETETVFVRTMARRQLGLTPGSSMKPNDKRVDSIVRMLGDVSNDRQLQLFWQEYSGMLPLPNPWWKGHPADEKPLLADEKPLMKIRNRLRSEDERGMQGGAPPTPPVAPTRKRRTKTPETQIPQGWSPTAKHAELAAELGLSRKLQSEAKNFVDHAHAHGRKLANWDSGFSMWLRKAAEWSNGRNDLNVDREPPPAHQELALPILEGVLTELPELNLD